MLSLKDNYMIEEITLDHKPVAKTKRDFTPTTPKHVQYKDMQDDDELIPIVTKINGDTFVKVVRKSELKKQVKEEKATFMNRKPKVVTALTVGISILTLSQKALAQSPSLTTKVLGRENQLGILPPEIVELANGIIIGLATIGVATAGACVILYGLMRIVGQSAKVKLWLADIIKGLGIVLLAPVLIIVLVKLTTMLFRGIPELEAYF